MRERLFPAGELAVGEMRQVVVGGSAIVVLRKPDGTFAALRDVCPHKQVQFSVGGTIERMTVSSEDGGYALSDEFVLRCPAHGFEFRVDTGRCPADPEKTRVRAYDVEVEGDQLFLTH